MTTLNPSDKDANVTLSGSNLVASITEASGSSKDGAVRGTTSKTTGKFYLEAQWSGSQSGTSRTFWFGVAQIGADLSATPLTPGSGYGVGAWYGGTSGILLFVSPDAGLPSSAANFATGDYMGFAVDIDNALGWVSKNGTWLDFGAGDDPTTGTGGCAIDGGATWYPVAGLGSVTFGTWSLTVNFGGSAFNSTAPTGFVAWDAAAAGGQPFTKRWGGMKFSGYSRAQQGRKRWLRQPHSRQPGLLMPDNRLILPKRKLLRA